MNPPPPHELYLRAAACLGEAFPLEHPHRSAVFVAAEPWLGRLRQPQNIGDSRWARGFRRALTAPEELTADELAERTRACDTVVLTVEGWRFRQFRAAVLAEPHDPARISDDAWFLAWVAGQAQLASRGQPRRRRERLAEEALELLQRKFAGYDTDRLPQGGGPRPLSTWAQKMFRWWLIDEFWNEKRRRSIEDWGNELAGTHAADGVNLAGWCASIRAVVEAAQFFPNSPDGPDHYAAFVFELRLRLASRLGPGTDVDPAPLVAAARWLPWPAWIGPRRFLPGWPRLTDLWAGVECYGHIPPSTRPNALVGECVRARTSDANWNADTWNHWVWRGVAGVRKRTEPELWNSYLAPFFPQNQSSEDER